MTELTKDMQKLLHEAQEISLSLFAGEYPYIIPVNFVFINDVVYFHSACECKKIDLIKNNSNVAFMAYVDVELKPEFATSFFKSITASAKAEIVQDNKLKSQVLTALAQKYMAACTLPTPETKLQKTAIIALNIQKISYRNKNKLKK